MPMNCSEIYAPKPVVIAPTYFPKGLNTIINRGNNVNAVISAINIARPVRRPKRIVGIKYDKTRMENPAIIVREV